MMIKTYRKSNIDTLSAALQDDEFDDTAKHEAQGYVYTDDSIQFVERNLGEACPVLDVGCGSGVSFEFFPITHGVDINAARLQAAARRNGNVELRQAAAECLPDDIGKMEAVLHLQGFFQLRSDYEALIEYNRILELGGRFIFDLPQPNQNIVFGRSFSPRSYVKVVQDFGFRLLEYREFVDGFVGIAVEKFEEFNPTRLRKLQVVPEGDGLFQVKNLIPGDMTYR